jgi:hypothetical protein
MHCAFGGVFIVLLLFVVLTMALLFYDSNCSGSNCLQRVASGADVAAFGSKALLTLTLVMFNNVSISHSP